jgi:sugar phosphate isomerase/epimerase
MNRIAAAVAPLAPNRGRFEQPDAQPHSLIAAMPESFEHPAAQATLSRRHLLAQSAIAAGALAAAAAAPAVGESPAEKPVAERAGAGRGAAEPFGYCLNTSTIRGQGLGLVAEVELAAKAGYQAIEPWLGEIDKYAKGGGSLPDLRKRIADLGLKVPSAIGFAPWIVDDDTQRAKGLEAAKRDMDLVRAIGGTRIAAPPAGATDKTVGLSDAARRYRALLELGESMGVTPQAEVWGFSKSLTRLSETAFTAIESGHSSACVLPDIYHLHKGGSGFDTTKLLSGLAVHMFHVNDYPAEPDRTAINDSHRVYPGDGVAPLRQIVRDLRASGFRGYLSLELFNRDYWKQDAEKVARTGLAKMREMVQQALAEPA